GASDAVVGSPSARSHRTAPGSDRKNRFSGSSVMAKAIKSDLSVHAAALGAAALIAHQVGGKAVRDALFLSQFDVAGLASMVIVASVLSILIGVGGAKLMSSIPPGKVVPRAFLVSAGLLLLAWAISWWSVAV